MTKSIKIASGQGFWGDLPRAPVDQVRNGKIDYLMMDYLAEVTMSIMQKQKLSNPDLGYARDFVKVIDEILYDISNGSVKVISNAGGVNPLACKNAILDICESKNIKNIRIAVVDGDDILDNLPGLIKGGHELKNMDTGKPIEPVIPDLLSANVYFGANPIVEALQGGANLVITGRVTDTGLCLAPMIHEFGWSFNNYDLMASGTIAGHIIECGAQSSGGNFTDWKLINNFIDIGFPIIEAFSDGTFVVTKHNKTGGLVHSMTVKEQLLYEIGNPEDYITPDCIADFTSVHLEDLDKNKVLVKGIKGKKATEYYKVSASYADGYKLSTTLTYSWPDALEKSAATSNILKERAKILGLIFDNYHIDFIGYNGCNEKLVSYQAEYDEICLRITASGKNKKDLDRFGMEIAPLILTGPGSVTGFAGGRPKASEIVAYWPALIRKDAISPKVTFFEH